MKFKFFFVVFILLYLLASLANAYELKTHAQLTDKAYLQTKLALSNSPLLLSLGLNILNQVDIFGDKYYDVDTKNGRVLKRNIDKYSFDRMDNSDEFYLEIRGWLMRGTIREDDVNHFGDNPLDGLEKQMRVFNHFFNPTKNKGLTVDVVTFPTSVNWALGTSNAFATPMPDARNVNHFTIFDASKV